MYIDLKCTVWERVKLSDEQAAQVKELLKNGGSDYEVVRLIDEFCLSSELLLDTLENVPQDENSRYPTVELFTDKGESVITN